jgi:hypothetical protein
MFSSEVQYKKRDKILKIIIESKIACHLYYSKKEYKVMAVLFFFWKGSAGKFPNFFFVFSIKCVTVTEYTGLQSSQSQNTKANTLREILTPTSKSSPDLLLSFDANQPKLFLESNFPTHEIAILSVKDDVISTFLDYLASCND